MDIRKVGKALAVMILTVVPVAAQQVSGAYDYPVKPETSGWKALKSHDDMQRVCQIPETILRNMSTADLAETCLNYPLYGDMFAFDEFQKGFESVTSGFNGLQELLERNDAGIKLYEEYRQMDPEAFGRDWPTVKKGEYAAKFYEVEILLAQEQILANFQRELRTLLIRECIRKAQAKSKYPEIYGILSFSNLALVTGRIMVNENYVPFAQKVAENKRLRSFLQDASFPDSNLVNEILDQATLYVNEN